MKQNPYVACNTHGLVQQSTVLYTYGSLSFDRDTIVKQFRIFGPNWSSYWWTFAACSLLLFFVRLAPSWFHMQIHATTMLYATLCRSVLWVSYHSCNIQVTCGMLHSHAACNCATDDGKDVLLRWRRLASVKRCKHIMYGIYVCILTYIHIRSVTVDRRLYVCV